MAENLKKLLKSVTPTLRKEKLVNKFEEIAKDIMTNYIIKKGNTTYEFLEIEFYYFSNNHHDLITYPRKAEAGEWFFHASGVDICFDSNVQLDEKDKIIEGQDENDIYFGGILIRSLKKTDDEGNIKYITGPQKCCYDLFDKFSALSKDGKVDNFPHLEFNERGKSRTATSCPRYFKFAKDVKNDPDSKMKKLYADHWLFEPKIKSEDFKRFITSSEYRYFDKETFKNENLPTKNSYYVGLPIND